MWKPPEAVDASVAGSTLHVGYHHARFRCSQSVQGFVRDAADRVDLLVQPIDMNPTMVVLCGCAYDIAVDLASSRGANVAVYRRGDHYGGADDPPLLVGTASGGTR